MSTIECTSCGTQYRWTSDIDGKRIKCKNCETVFLAQQTVDADIALEEVVATPSSFAATSPPSTRTSVADEIDYELFGDDMQFCEITLDPQETVIAEAGAMMYMSSAIKMETVFGDPSAQSQSFWGKVATAGKRALTGESVFMTTFTNVGHKREIVAFGAPYPGKIIPMHLDQMGGQIICQKDAFLCGARGLKVDIAFQKKIGVGLFGGEGFIMQRISGDGIAMVHAGGTMMHRELAAGEVMKLDTGCLMALAPSVEYDIEFVGGFKNTFFGGEGLFLATLRGPGKIWCQSLPFSRLAGRILANASGVTRKQGEGSLLDGLGGIGSMFMGDND